MIKRGFTISEMLVVMVIIGIISAVTIPMLTMKEKIKDYEISSITCARTELAASVTFPATTPSTACTSAISKAQFGKESAINTLAFLMSNGKDANEKTAAAKILRTACDNGGDKACGYFVKACQKDSTLCDTGGLYDLRYYLELLPETNNHAGDSAKFLMYDDAKPLYDSNNTNIKNIVDYACCPNINMACYIKGCTECPWARHYGGSVKYVGAAADDVGRGIAVSGNYIYVSGTTNTVNCGTSYSSFVMKLNKSDGSIVWKKKWGAPHVWFHKLTVSGNYIYVIGEIEDNNAWLKGSLVAMKLNMADGSMVWARRYGLPDSYQSSGYNLKLANGFLYITGREYPAAPNRIIVLKMRESDGLIIWKNQYGNSATSGHDSNGNGIEVSIDGTKLYVVGRTQINDGSLHAYIMKLNESDGTVIWRKAYGGSVFSSVIAPGDGNVYVGGDNVGYKMMLLKLTDTNDATGGSVVWKKQYANTSGNYINNIIASGSSIYVTGAEGADPAGGNQDIVVMDVNASNGSVRWKKQFGGTGIDTASAMVLSGDFLYITGNTKSHSAGVESNIIVLKINTNQQFSNITGWTDNGSNVTFWWGLGENYTIPYTADTTGWTFSGDPGLTHGEPITHWVLPNDTDQNLGASVMSGFWTACNDTDIIEWDNEGVTLDTEKIPNSSSGWTVGLKRDGVPSF